MKKALIIFGLLILFAVLIVNRLFFTILAPLNIILCVIAAILIVGGVLIKEKR